MKASPINLPRVFPIAERTISIDGSETDWLTITPITPEYFNSNSWNRDIEYVRVVRDSSYLYWMIKFISPTQPGRYYSFYLYRSSSAGYCSINASIQQNGSYSISAYPSQYNYSGTSADYRIGGFMVEGRIPIWLVDLRSALGLGVSASNWDTGYWTSLFDSSMLSGTSTPVAVAGADQVVYDSVPLNGRVIYPDKVITSWEWSLRHRTYSAYNCTATGPSPTLTDLAPGIYDVTLTVIDDLGKTYTDTMLLVATGQTAGLYTQADLDQAVQEERNKWDANRDGKIGLEEAIRALQVTSGMRDE